MENISFVRYARHGVIERQYDAACLTAGPSLGSAVDFPSENHLGIEGATPSCQVDEETTRSQ
jgi:hypothetical protein